MILNAIDIAILTLYNSLARLNKNPVDVIATARGDNKRRSLKHSSILKIEYIKV